MISKTVIQATRTDARRTIMMVSPRMKRMVCFIPPLAHRRGLASPAHPIVYTFDASDNYVPEGLEESLATIEKLEKPVVCYKVLAAGRVKPADTLPYVFRRLKRRDGICVGVFPHKNPHEVAENVALTKQCTQEATG